MPLISLFSITTSYGSVIFQLIPNNLKYSKSDKLPSVYSSFNFKAPLTIE
jgi:hypothetical protein